MRLQPTENNALCTDMCLAAVIATFSSGTSSLMDAMDGHGMMDNDGHGFL